MSTSFSGFNEREMRYMAAAFIAARGGVPAVDLDKMSKLLGMTKGSTSNIMGPLKKKIQALADEGGLASTHPNTAAAKKAKAGTRSNSQAANSQANGNGYDDEDVDDGALEEKLGVKKAGGGRKRKMKSEETNGDADGEGEGEGAAVPKKRGGRKPAAKKIKREVTPEAEEGYGGYGGYDEGDVADQEEI